MPRNILVSLALAACALLGVAAFAAEEQGALAAELRAFRIASDTRGGERRLPAGEVRPGDLVEYEAIYRNHGAERIHGLAPVLPVPAGLEFVPGSAHPSALEATTDGSAWAPVPLRRQLARPDGGVEWVEVPAAEYRALRWSLGDLDAAKSATVRARMRVAPLPAVAAGPAAAPAPDAQRGAR